jgi:hypothetical protein
MVGLEAISDLLSAVGSNTASIPAESYAELSYNLFGYLCIALKNNNEAYDFNSAPQSVRQGLLLVLKAYGVPLDDIKDTSLGSDGDGTSIPGSLK